MRRKRNIGFNAKVRGEIVKQFEIRAKVKFLATILVEAENEDEALEKFNKLDWISDDMDVAEIVDFAATSKPKLIE